MKNLRILIVGGGIAGLATARALHDELVAGVSGLPLMLGRGKSFLTIPLGQGRVYCYCDIGSSRAVDSTGGDVGRLRQLFEDFARSRTAHPRVHLARPRRVLLTH